MSTAGPDNVLAEDAAVVGEEAIITVTLVLHQVPKDFACEASHHHHTSATSMYGFVLSNDILERLAIHLGEILEAEIDKFAKPHASEQQQLDP
jgi:hypothetical protein